MAFFLLSWSAKSASVCLRSKAVSYGMSNLPLHESRATSLMFGVIWLNLSATEIWTSQTLKDHCRTKNTAGKSRSEATRQREGFSGEQHGRTLRTCRTDLPYVRTIRTYSRVSDAICLVVLLRRSPFPIFTGDISLCPSPSPVLPDSFVRCVSSSISLGNRSNSFRSCRITSTSLTRPSENTTSSVNSRTAGEPDRRKKTIQPSQSDTQPFFGVSSS